MTECESDDHDLISSARVEGTPVHDRRGDRIGSVHSVMLHKVTGQTMYAVLSFGGFMGVGARCLPVAWDQLRYEPELRGYQLPMTREDIEAAPYMALDRTDRPHEQVEPVYRQWDRYL